MGSIYTLRLAILRHNPRAPTLPLPLLVGHISQGHTLPTPLLPRTFIQYRGAGTYASGQSAFVLDKLTALPSVHFTSGRQQRFLELTNRTYV